MIYKIEQINDLSGALLVIRFPAEELDRKALNTIEQDLPEFLVPFRYRCVDGQVECTYELGSLTKLRYLYGSRTPKEYAELWTSVLQPLLDCEDWFMKPFSFVLNSEYLYVNKSGLNVRFLYVPSRQDCTNMDDLQNMAMELSQKNTVTSPELENKVLKAIMQDFRPREFLRMLRDSVGAVVEKEKPQEEPAPFAKPKAAVAAVINAFVAPEPEPIPAAQPAPEPAPVAETPVIADLDMDDIQISFNGGDKQESADKKWGLFGGKKEKAPKEKAAKESLLGGLFGKKGKKEKNVILGAGAEPEMPAAPAYQAPVYQAPVQQSTMQQSYQMNPTVQPDDDDEVTKLDECFGPCLRLTGDASLPHEITVELNPGQDFTIGRFDVSVGRKQSNFEFAAGTKAVSRHHAVISMDQAGNYFLMDLSSSAGTFLNGSRLQPNVPQQLQRGNRISFGTSGADYIWEV